MEPSRALGLWRSTFGAVKIEADNSKGGLQMGAVQGVWVYQRQGQEVVGYFSGNLRGNVLQFRWQEPNNPPLTGEGWLRFDPNGNQYSGRWWSDHKDRVGDWNGSRQQSAQGGYGQDPNGYANPGEGQQPYPPQGGQYPPQGGQYPPQGGQYPPQGGQYPPQGGQYPPQGGQYPPQGQQPQPYPPQGGQYPQGQQPQPYPPQNYPQPQPQPQPQRYPPQPQGGNNYPPPAPPPRGY
jgi:hypothetical protein